jgi:deazaflavin-dependent oxidoreductase (nitroreductase family)
MKSAGGVREAPDLTSAGTKWSAGDRRLRSFFRQLNRFMLWMWRVGLGRWINAWPAVGGRIMVVTHRGRRSGRLYRTPLNYAPVGEAVYCTAGFGSRADWYRNLIAHPHVEVWLPRERWSGMAEDVSNAPDRSLRLRQVLIASGFAAYLAGINPRRVEDEELEKRADGYRLVRIRPIGS